MKSKIKPDRIDFVFNAKCETCKKPLPSSTAKIFVDAVGNEYFFGPTCAEKALPSDRRHELKNIPDLTRANIPDMTAQPPKKGLGVSQIKNKGVSDNVRRNCIEYLLLRQEKLVTFQNVAWEVLENTYVEYKNNNDLSPKSLKILQSTMASHEGNRLGKKNLMTAYAYDFLLTRVLAKLPESQPGAWLKGQQKLLRRRGWLPHSNAGKINKWFVNHLGNRYSLFYDGFYQPDT